MAAKQASGICVGIGGWTFEPWRETFYPKGLAQKRELEYASRQVTSIEINGTYYGSQKPETFAKWREEAPEGFVFSVKGTRFTTNRRVLAEAGESIERFVGSGITELKEKLGPINWQFLPTKQFDPKDFEAFLKLLPHSVDGHALRHVVEVRHDSFRNPEFIDMLRAHKVAVVLTDKDGFPEIPDVTAPFRLCPAAGRLGRDRDRLCPEGAGPMGQAGQGLGRGRRPGRPEAGRGAGEEGAEVTRRLHLHDQRLQTEGSRRGHGADQEAGVKGPLLLPSSWRGA